MTGFGIRVWLVCLLRAFAERAVAQPTSVDWRAPAACPDRAALMVEIERLLGATDEGSGTRHFQAQDCSDILRLAAFSIALAIDPTLGVRAAPLPPENRAAPWAFREGR